VADSDRKVTVTVRVELKPGVLDAEADSIEKSLGLLGLTEVVSVRTARLYDLDIRAADRAAAERLAATAVDRLLANPVIHRVTVQSTGG
jgi:phosphoribosylformylglycinamidine synthase PurS subunit